VAEIEGGGNDAPAQIKSCRRNRPGRGRSHKESPYISELRKDRQVASATVLTLDNRADSLEPARDATLDPLPADITLYEIFREGTRDAARVEGICRVH
jgi:hypothetical protein